MKNTLEQRAKGKNYTKIFTSYKQTKVIATRQVANKMFRLVELRISI
jgi:hypothetical protein